MVTEILDGLREMTKDASSHVFVAGLVAFAHENHFIFGMATVGVAILIVAWAYHFYKTHHEKKQKGGQ